MSQTAAFPKLKRGLVAILRGLKPTEAVAIGQALFETPHRGDRSAVEFARAFCLDRGHCRGASKDGVGRRRHGADGSRCRWLAQGRRALLVSPNIDAEVMARAMHHGMVTMPGVFTPTEAFHAIRLGASALKFFPASVLGAAGISAIRAVLPRRHWSALSAAFRKRTLPATRRWA